MPDGPEAVSVQHDRKTNGSAGVQTTPETYLYDANQNLSTVFSDGLNDLVQAAAMVAIWARLGWLDFRHQTSRAVLGPLWSIIGTGITVGVLGFVYGAVLDLRGSASFPYIAAGFVVWFFISGCINGGLSAYVSARGVLEERSLPIAFTAFRFVFRYFIEMMFKFVVFIVAAAAVALPISANIFFALPGLIILVLNGLWVVLFFGPLGARYRDINEFMSPMMLVAFLASPVLWPQAVLGTNEFIALFNPFAHFLAIVREPLLGSPPPTLSVLVTLSFTVVGWIVAIVSHCLTKNRVVFWL